MSITLKNVPAVFILLLAANFSLVAQYSVSGKVTDAETNEPLVGATVL
ncbi:MAG: hypothetical protein HC896_17350 [Bacteroidales bacterium]|nr:hypothetical protein [Bacteroidales bacterium]